MALALTSYTNNNQTPENNNYGIFCYFAHQTLGLLQINASQILDSSHLLACKIKTLAQNCFEQMNKTATRAYTFIFGGELEALKPRDAVDRIFTLHRSTGSQKLLELINPSSSLSRLVARLFLEHIYGRKYSQITSVDTRKVILGVHPDKNPAPEAKELFQLHHKLLEIGDLTNSTGGMGAQAWVIYKLFGWLGRSIIQASIDKDIASVKETDVAV